jgi:type II secretory pathway pseudopilin PulG
MKSNRSKNRNQKGYLLLSVMLLIAIMLLMLSIEAPRMAQQIKRDKETELIHRGKEYAKAVRKYVRKTGTYPTTLEQLEDTNHVRFLRKRYEDPMTGKAEWKLIHQGEAEVKIPQNNNNPGLQGSGNPGLTGSTNATASPTPQGGTIGGGGTLGGSGGLGGTGTLGGQPSGQAGTLQTSNIGNGQQFGGGGIIGVASTSKESGIHEFNGSSEYDKWLFVYDPKLEQAAATMGGSADAGIAVASPRAGGDSGGASPSGSPAPGGSPVPGVSPNPNPSTTPTPPL